MTVPLVSSVGRKEALTHKLVVRFFEDALGYRYHGRWKDRPGNSNVEEALLAEWLARQGQSDRTINKVLFEPGKAASLGGSKTHYEANREDYGLLRYGVKVRPEVGEQTVTVWLIHWASPGNNAFAIAVALSDVGGSLRALEALIAKSWAIKQAAMQQLLTSRVRPVRPEPVERTGSEG